MRAERNGDISNSWEPFLIRSWNEQKMYGIVWILTVTYDSWIRYNRDPVYSKSIENANDKNKVNARRRRIYQKKKEWRKNEMKSEPRSN